MKYQLETIPVWEAYEKEGECPLCELVEKLESHYVDFFLGHSVMVTNRGLHTTCNCNSQQNRLTPDCPDTVTREIPSEAIYLYDPENCKWY